MFKKLFSSGTGKNVIINTIGSYVGIAITVLSVVILARTLGREVYGELAVLSPEDVLERTLEGVLLISPRLESHQNSMKPTCGVVQEFLFHSQRIPHAIAARSLGHPG